MLGIGLGILATRSSTANLDSAFDATLVAQTLGFATPLVFAAMGGMFSERSGVVNIGLEGMMLMGAFWGVYGADKGGTWVVGLLVAMAVGGLFALVYAFFAIQLRADQIVGGTGDQLPRRRDNRLLLRPALQQQPDPERRLAAAERPHSGALRLPRAGDRRPQHPDLGELRARDRRVRRPLQDGDRPADPRLRRASARGRHGRDRRLRRSATPASSCRGSSPRSAASTSPRGRRGTGRSSST